MKGEHTSTRPRLLLGGQLQLVQLGAFPRAKLARHVRYAVLANKIRVKKSPYMACDACRNGVYGCLVCSVLRLIDA